MRWLTASRSSSSFSLLSVALILNVECYNGQWNTLEDCAKDNLICKWVYPIVLRCASDCFALYYSVVGSTPMCMITPAAGGGTPAVQASGAGAVAPAAVPSTPAQAAAPIAPVAQSTACPALDQSQLTMNTNPMGGTKISAPHYVAYADSMCGSCTCDVRDLFL